MKWNCRFCRATCRGRGHPYQSIVPLRFRAAALLTITESDKSVSPRDVGSEISPVRRFYKSQDYPGDVASGKEGKRGVTVFAEGNILQSVSSSAFRLGASRRAILRWREQQLAE